MPLFHFEQIDPDNEDGRLRVSLAESGEALGVVYPVKGAGLGAEHAGLTGTNSAVHGFQSEQLAAEFLYRFKAPQRSERSHPTDRPRPLNPELLPRHGVLAHLVPIDDGDFLVNLDTRGAGSGIGYLQQRDDGRYDVRAGHRSVGICERPETGLWVCLQAYTGTTGYIGDFVPHEPVGDDGPAPAGVATARYLTGHRVAAHAGTPPRIDVVVDRDPDNDTITTVFLNGAESGQADDVTVHTIDPGRSGADEEWWQGMHDHPDGTPPAVRSHIEETAALYRR